MSLRFVTKDIHAYIDYPLAVMLIVAPMLLKLGQSNPLAARLSIYTGVAALILPIFTDHKTGVVRVIPYWLHLMVDRFVGIVFIAAPFIFGFTGLDAWYYWVNAAALFLATTVLNAPEATVRLPSPSKT
jgi:hypothetical protein